MTEPRTPTTAAGRRLLRVIEGWDLGERPDHERQGADLILAIEAEAEAAPTPADPAPKMMLNGKMNPDYLAWNERRKALPPAEPMLDVKLLRQEVGKQLTDARVDGWVRGMSVPLHGREVSVDLQSRYLAATIRAAVLNIIDPLPDAKEPQP